MGPRCSFVSSSPLTATEVDPDDIGLEPTVVPVADSDAPARVGAMLIWRGMVKFPLQRGWVWLKPGSLPGSAIQVFLASDREASALTPAFLTRNEAVAAVAFLAVSPL